MSRGPQTTTAKKWTRARAGLSGCFLILLIAHATVFKALAAEAETNARVFVARGVIQEISLAEKSVVIKHEAISNYMGAMIMPFNIKDPSELSGRQRGDQVTFRLHVTEDQSWVDDLVKIGTTPLPPVKTNGNSGNVSVPPHSTNPLLDYSFTNELGQAVSLHSFRGQALAITFFYTRCPIPDFCPRLSKNFQEASRKLAALTNAPSNWHFLSFSFDPEFDTPAMLKAYGQGYEYDPAHWSFLTGPPDKIAQFAEGSGVTFAADHGTINHNFRTLIIDANGHLQTVFPTGGNLSDDIVAEIIKAAAVTNEALAKIPPP